MAEKTMPHYSITVGELRKHLDIFSDDCELFFGSGNLEFYRTKSRGDKLLQIEFSQNTWPDIHPDLD